MSASFFIKSITVAIGGTILESKFAPSSTCSDCKRRLSALTPLILLGTGFWITMHGMVVGQARSKAIEDAKADGETDVEERYALPNLYAQGTSRHVKRFNAVQRSHQHIFETLPQVMLSSMVAAMEYPCMAAVSTLIWAAGRISFTKAYAACEGDVSKRYSNPLARYMWYGMLMNYFVGMIVCVKSFATKSIKN